MGESFWCSPEFERITGRKNSSYEEATELRYPGFHVDDLPHVRASFRALHRGDKKSGESFEARIVRPDGAERWVRVHHHLVTSRNGRWLKAVGLVQDCDALKRQEIALKEAQAAAEAGAEAKAAFLANMSHEIRTPMNGVMGVLHLLKNERAVGRRAWPAARGAVVRPDAGRAAERRHRLLEDRGRPPGAGVRARRSRHAGGRRRCGCWSRQAKAKDLKLIVDADPSLGWVQVRSGAAAPGAVQPGGQCGEVHRDRPCDGPLPADRRRPCCASRSRTPASAFRPPRSRQAVRALQPGRRLHDPQLRRLGPGPGHHPQAGRDDGRPGRLQLRPRARARPSGSRSPPRRRKPRPRQSRRPSTC